MYTTLTKRKGDVEIKSDTLTKKKKKKKFCQNSPANEGPYLTKALKNLVDASRRTMRDTRPFCGAARRGGGEKSSLLLHDAQRGAVRLKRDVWTTRCC
jgi:hypothetical protein